MEIKVVVQWQVGGQNPYRRQVRCTNCGTIFTEMSADGRNWSPISPICNCAYSGVEDGSSDPLQTVQA